MSYGHIIFFCKPYSTDVNDDEWAFIAPYLMLMTEDAPQRQHDHHPALHGLLMSLIKREG